jgi:hypothetical protein
MMVFTSPDLPVVPATGVVVAVVTTFTGLGEGEVTGVAGVTGVVFSGVDVAVVEGVVEALLGTTGVEVDIEVEGVDVACVVVGVAVTAVLNKVISTFLPLFSTFVSFSFA